MAQECLDIIDYIKLQSLSRLRQEAKLLDIDIIVRGMEMPTNILFFKF